MENLVEPVPSQFYMFDIPPGLQCMWSARAIYNNRGEVYLDILHDRQCMHGDRDCTDAQKLCRWLNTSGINGLKKECSRQAIYPNDTRHVEYKSRGFIIRGTPNASYGYLYIVSYKIPANPDIPPV